MAREMRYASIVLCAGRGRRMAAPRTPKVCFSIAGKPAVIHLLEGLTGQGYSPNILVVGHLAGQVVDLVGPEFPGTVFAFQTELLGTGHAAKQGMRVLQEAGFDGGVLVVAGDKVIEPRALEKLRDAFDSKEADMALLVAPKDRWPNAGRIVTDGAGRVLRCIERTDLEHAEESGDTFEIAGEQRTAEEIESSVEWVNQATYVFRADALFGALDQLGTGNVQEEEYLTDCMEILARSGKTVVAVPVDDPDDVLGFNNPQELLEIEDHFRRRASVEVKEEAAADPAVFKSPETWARCLRESGASVGEMLTGIYGHHPELCEEKRNSLLEAVDAFVERFGPEGKVAVVRAPGRVNLLGRHVDHRGGSVNLMAIDREQILVARPRTDTMVRARNMDQDRFEDLEFSEGELLEQVLLDDWMDFVDSETVIKMVRDLRGNWGNYLKAPLLRLQHRFKDRQILGVDCLLHGDIPMAAGLSSSSALVVAMAEALVLANGLDVTPHDLVDMCGEGEWFVGTRGGSGDHAAVKFSQFGQVAHVGFFPFSIMEYAPFPSDYALVICNSRVQARKAEGAKDIFNERVASYELATHLVRKRFPKYAPFIDRLRDISPNGLGVPPTEIYRILLEIPERMTPEELRDELGTEVCGRVFASHRQPSAYRLRGRLLFGIAECARSQRCITCLEEGTLKELGRLMNLSHDGDRVADTDGKPYSGDMNDATLAARIQDLQSEDPERVLAGQLCMQPGSYACSTTEIDRMVDIALNTRGVLGAQLSGAGLGGCMMVLARKQAADDVVRRMTEHYYEPNNLEPGALSFTPIAGSGPLTLEP